MDYFDIEAEWADDYDYCSDTRRSTTIKWLNDNGFEWEECRTFEFHGCELSLGYIGDICVKAPYNFEDPRFQLLSNYIQLLDGIDRDENVRICVVTLEEACEHLEKIYCKTVH